MQRYDFFRNHQNFSEKNSRKYRKYFAVLIYIKQATSTTPYIIIRARKMVTEKQKKIKIREPKIDEVSTADQQKDRWSYPLEHLQQIWLI